MEIAATIIECLISMYFLIRFLGTKNIKYKEMAFAVTFLLLFAVNFFLSELDGWEIICVVIFCFICFLYSVISLHGSVFRKAFSCILIYLLLNIKSNFLFNILAMSLNLEDVSILFSNTNIGLRLLVLFLGQFSFFLLVKIILSVNHKFSYNFMPLEWAFIIFSFVISSFIGTAIWYLNIDYSQLGSAISLISTLGLIVWNILLFLLLQYLGKENLKRKEAALLQIHEQESKKLFEQMGEQYTEIRKIKHDMKGCIDCSLRLLQDKNYSEAEEYLKTFLSEKTENIVSAVFTDSSVINAVINSKIAQCGKYGIEYKCEITKKLQAIPEFELSIFLSNLFDNAIEACQSVKENKYISLSIMDVKSYLHIVMKNTIEGSVLKENPDLNSTKKDNVEQHGYGLKSVRDIVKKYNGSMQINEQEGYFVVDVILNMVQCEIS